MLTYHHHFEDDLFYHISLSGQVATCATLDSFSPVLFHVLTGRQVERGPRVPLLLTPNLFGERLFDAGCEAVFLVRVAFFLAGHVGVVALHHKHLVSNHIVILYENIHG